MLQDLSSDFFQGQDDIKNMISPSSSSAKLNKKKSRIEKSWSPSKLEELNQVSNPWFSNVHLSFLNTSIISVGQCQI